MLGNSASGALTPALSGWAKWGNQKPFIVNPSSLTYQWKMSCAACLLATLPPGNSISLEDKQNGGYRKDRLAPVATGKPLLFTQHKACGGCGAPEKLWDWCIIPVCICCWRMSSPVFHDMGWSICVFFFFSFFFWPLHFKRPAQLHKGYQIHSTVPSGVNSSNQPTGKRHRTGRRIIFCPAFAKINTHITTDCSSLRVGPLLCETSKHGLLIMGTAIPTYMLAN